MRKNFIRLMGVFCTVAFTLSPPAQALGGKEAVLELIEGAGSAVIRSADGTSRPAAQGAKLRSGDRLETGPGASAKILYPDGSKLLVGQGSAIEIQERQGKTQFNQIHSGSVRGLIRKTGPLGRNAPPRFIIRSKAAVMGVRGTDFFLQLKPSLELEIHTLDGTVEVAEDVKALVAGKGISVPRDQMVAFEGSKIPEPKPFDREVFEERLTQTQPELNSMVKKDPEAFQAAQEKPADPVKPEPLKEPREEKPEPKEEVKKEPKAEPAADAPPRPRVELALFQVSPIYMSQKDGGKLISGELSWSPRLRIWSVFSLRGTLGAFPAKNGDGGSLFVALETTAQLVVGLLEDRLLLEPGLSWKRWDGETGDSDTSPIYQVSLRLGGLGPIERVFAAYTEYGGFHDRSLQNVRSQLFKLGIGLKF